MRQIYKVLMSILLVSMLVVVTNAYPAYEGNIDKTDTTNVTTEKSVSSGSSGGGSSTASTSTIKIKAYGYKSNRINIYKDDEKIGHVAGGAGYQKFLFPYGGNYKIEAVPSEGYEFDKFCNAVGECVTTNPIEGYIAPTGNYLTYKGYFKKVTTSPVPYSGIFGEFVESPDLIDTGYGAKYYKYTFDLPKDANVFISMTGTVWGSGTDKISMAITINCPWLPDWDQEIEPGKPFALTEILPLKKGTYTVYLNVGGGEYSNPSIYGLVTAITVNQNGKIDGSPDRLTYFTC